MGISEALKPITVAANILGGIISSTEKLDKVSKLFISIFDGFQLFFSGEWLAPIGALRGRLEAFSKLVGAVSLINRIKEWVCVDDTLKGTSDEGKRFWQAKKTTWYKIGSRLTLTVAQAIDTLKFIDAMGILKLGKIAACTIGNIPVLNLIKDGFVVLSSGFTIIDSGIKLHKTQAVYNKFTSKRDIWEDISTYYKSREKINKSLKKSVKTKLDAKEKAIINKLKLKYSKSDSCELHKKERYKSYLENLDGGCLEQFIRTKLQIRSHELNQRNLALGVKQGQVDIDAEDYKNVINAQKAIAEKIARIADYQSVDDSYFAKYKYEVYTARATNLKRDRMKPWLDIANSIAKIAIISLSMTFLALGLASLPLWVVGLAVNVVGMKFLHEDIYREKLKEPVFVKA